MSEPLVALHQHDAIPRQVECRYYCWSTRITLRSQATVCAPALPVITPKHWRLCDICKAEALIDALPVIFDGEPRRGDFLH